MLNETQNAVCYCTMCRKFTGSLGAQSFAVRTAWISPALESNINFKIYSAEGSTCGRGFCIQCGSSLTFHSPSGKDGKTDEDTYIHVGCTDEEYLLGKRLSGKEESSDPIEFGGVLWDGVGRSWGRGLCMATSNIYCENDIEGVTDTGPGKRFWQGRTQGPEVDVKN